MQWQMLARFHLRIISVVQSLFYLTGSSLANVVY